MYIRSLARGGGEVLKRFWRGSGEVPERFRSSEEEVLEGFQKGCGEVPERFRRQRGWRGSGEVLAGKAVKKVLESMEPMTHLLRCSIFLLRLQLPSPCEGKGLHGLPNCFV